MATLTLIKSPGGTTNVEPLKLDGSLVVIGRSPEECQIIIQSNSVSRKHAQIVYDRGQFYVEDLKSRNGTEVNSKRIETRTPLKDQDRIKICEFLFRFADEQPEPVDVSLGPDDPQSTVEAAVQRVPPQLLLESQPSERLRALLDISASLSRSLKTDQLFPMIADVLFNVFKQADRCFIIVLGDQPNILIPKVIKTRRPGTTGERFSKTIVRKAMESQTSFLSEDAASDQNLGMSASIAEFRIRSVMCAPLVTNDGKSIGVIQLDSQDRNKKFTAEDVKLLTCVANQATIYLENARMHESLLAQQKEEQEKELARKVQRGFLPQRYPSVPGYEFFSHYEPARNVGGDYYDYFTLPDGRVAVLLGDVSGKGLPASLLMAKFGGVARACLLTNEKIADAITKSNDELMEYELNDRYITLAATRLDPHTHTIDLVNAGHMIPLIYRHETGELIDSMPDKGGFPIGWVPGFPYESHTIELPPGDSLLIFTDGVTDAESAPDVRFLMDGVYKALTGANGKRLTGLTPTEIGEKIIRAVKEFIGSFPQFDDIALICYGRLKER